MKSVGIYEARAALSQLVEQALSGEEIVITRRGKPAVKLVPVPKSGPPRKPGLLKGKYDLPKCLFEPLPKEVVDAFYESKIFPDDEKE
jgi:prevent-host-death family protein